MKIILIDIDNTILDFDGYVRECMIEGFRHFGLKPFEPWMYERFTKINNGLWRDIELGALTFEELQKIRWNLVFDDIGIDFDGPVFEKYFREFLNESAIPIEGSYELLEYLSKKYMVFAASNGPGSQQRRRIALAGMTQYFDELFISEELGASKPTREFFEACFERINSYDKKNTRESEEVPILPEDCLMIGDSVTADIIGGKDFGMRTCLFDRHGKKSDCKEADHIVKSLSDIITIL